MCSVICHIQNDELQRCAFCHIIDSYLCEGRHSRTCTLELETINVERVNVFSVLTFSLSKLRHMLLHLLKFVERFRWERIRSWKKWTSCIFLKFRMKKKKQIDTSLRISNDYSVHDQFSTEMTKNTNIYTHKDTVTTNSLQTRTNPVLHELQFIPRKKDVDNTHGQRTCNSRMTRLRLRWPALNHWTWKLTDMFAVTKTWAMEVYTLSFAISSGNSGGDSQLMVVFCHKMNVWARKIVNCSWDGLYDKNLSWNPVSILTKWSCSRAHPWSWKDFVSKLGLDGTPRSAWEWRRQGKHWWMFVAWHSYRRLWHMQNFHWSHELTTYAVLTLATSIWDSSLFHFLKYKCSWIALTDVTSRKFSWITFWSGRR